MLYYAMLCSDWIEALNMHTLSLLLVRIQRRLPNRPLTKDAYFFDFPVSKNKSKIVRTQSEERNKAGQHLSPSAFHWTSALHTLNPVHNGFNFGRP